MVNEIEETSLGYLLSPEFELINSAGKPLTGGWIEVYIHGTRTKYYTYSDWNGTLHPFKIPLDSLGANIVLASPAHSYDVYVYNKFGTLVMSRYNVLPQIAGTAVISGSVNIESSDDTVNIEVTGDNNFDISIADTVDRVESLETVVDSVTGDITVITDTVNGLVSGKKDIQVPYSASGSPTKTVTSVTQDENGVITVAYSDIDLPQQVPNIEIESSTLDVVSSIDPETNTKTFTIDTRSVTGDASFAYGDPNNSSYIINPLTSPAKLAGSLPTRMVGNDIAYDEFNRRFVLKAGAYFVNFNVEASANSVDDSTQQVYAEIAGTGRVHDRGTVTLDRTVSGQKSEIDISAIIFAPNDNYVIEIKMGADSDIPLYGKVSHWDIFRIDRGGISGGSVPGHEYTAGWGIEIDQDDEISVDPSILDQYVTEGELASAISGLAPEYSAGDNIVIDDDTISLSDVVTIHAREGETSSGSISFGNIVHWGQQDYGPGWAIEAYTDQGRGYHSFNTCDIGLQAFYWGDYDHDRDTNSVSGQSMLLISEGDIKYQQGDFQSTDTLPVIWSCSQMAQDISELQEAITAVTGVSADNIVDYDDADLFNKVEAIYNDGRSPIVRYTYSSTPGQGFPYSKETYFTEFFRYSEDNEHGHTNGYRFNYERNTGNYIENELIHFNSDGVKEHTNQIKNLALKGGDGISVVSGYNGTSTVISINPTEVATAISGLIPTGSNYSAGTGIDITNDIISVDNTVAMKTDIPEQEEVEFLELTAGDNINIVSGVISATQVQSDWTEANSRSPAYIKHKPALEDYTSLELFYETMNSSIADWSETTASAYSFIKNKPEEKALVAGENIVITENASAIVINSTGGGGGGSDVFAGDGIEIVSGVISVDNTVVRDQELETASGNLITYTDTVSGNIVDYIDGIDKDAVFWVGGTTTYQAITDAIAANKIPVYLDPQIPAKYGYLNMKGSNYYWFTAYELLDKQLVDYDKVYNYIIYSDDHHSNTIGYTGINTVAGNGIDIARTYSSQSKQGFQTISIDAAEIASSISGLLPSGQSYSAGDGIDITNDEISAKLGANMSFDNNDAITVDLTGVAEDAAGMVSGNLPQMELIAGNNIQLITSGVSAVINAVIPDAAKDAISANSYDNRGWETTGTVTTYNPFGLAIHPDLVYDSYTINASRLSVKEIGSGIFYLDLFLSITGTPKADYATYQNYITLTNGHFVSPTNSNVYDEWNNCFGCIYKSTLYGTGLDYNSLKPENPANRHYIQLHTVVGNW